MVNNKNAKLPPHISYKPYEYHFLNPAEIIDHSFQLYKKSFKAQILGHFLTSVIGTIIPFILLGIFLQVIDVLFEGIDARYYMSDYSIVAVLVYLAIYSMSVFTGMLGGSISRVFGVFLSYDAFLNRRTSINEALKTTFQRLLYILSVQGLKAFIFASVTGVLFYIAWIYFDLDVESFADSGNPVFWSVFLLSVLILLVIIAGWIISMATAYFNLVEVVAVVEKKFVFTAMKKVKILFGKNMLKTLFLLGSFSFTTWAVQLAILMGATMIISSLNALIGVNYIGLLTTVAFGSNAVIYLVRSGVVKPMQTTLTTLLCLNQKIKKDGLRLHIMLEKLNRQPM